MLLFVATTLINASIANQLHERGLLVSGSPPIEETSKLIGTFKLPLRSVMNTIVSIGSLKGGIEAYQHICTGTLLNADIVLTAAHCLHGLTIENIVVLAGVSNYRDADDRHVYSVSSYSHAGFAYKGYSSVNDVALIFLTRCVSTEGSLEFTKLNNQPDRRGSDTCELIETYGFGKHEQMPDRYYMSDGDLRILDHNQRIHSSQACSEAFINYYTKFKLRRKVPSKSAMELLKAAITSKHGCFGGDKTASESGYPCTGDSGGPVINSKAQYIIGVTSFTSEVCGSMPNYFTVVGYYDEWIKAEILRHKKLSCPDDYTDVNDLFTEPIANSVTTRLLTDETMSIDQTITYLTDMNNATCAREYIDLNSHLQEPIPDSESVHALCVDYLDCICDGDPSKKFTMVDAALPVWGSDSLRKSIPQDQQSSISRLLFCTSEYKVYYQSLGDAATIAFDYFDQLSVKDTCNLITA